MRMFIRLVLNFPFVCRMVLGRAFYPVLIVIGVVFCIGVAFGYWLRG